MAKDGVFQGGQQIAQKRLTGQQLRNALEVAGAAIGNLESIISTFSNDGPVGLSIDNNAPTVLANENAVLPVLPYLTDVEQGNCRATLLYALLDGKFQLALEEFVKRLSVAQLGEQKDLLHKFSQINWEAIARGTPEDAGTFEKVMAFFRQADADKAVRTAEKAELGELLILIHVPQVKRMLILAGGYARMLKDAWDLYERSKKSINKDDAHYKKVVGQMLTLEQIFKESEDQRLVSAQRVEDLSDQLERALETVEAVAGDKNRSDEVKDLATLTSSLVDAMISENLETMGAQEALLGTMQRGVFILTQNKVSDMKIRDAMESLSLFFKAYIALQYLLSLVQIFLITASTAIKIFPGTN